MKCAPEKATVEDFNCLRINGCVTEFRKQYGANYSTYFISVYPDLISHECSREHFPPQGTIKGNMHLEQALAELLVRVDCLYCCWV